jgi:uncharacterized membrane protein YhfC
LILGEYGNAGGAAAAPRRTISMLALAAIPIAISVWFFKKYEAM